MNNKYLLEKFDILISEIQNSENITSEYMLTLLYTEIPQSHTIYEVEFSNSNTKQPIRISKGINNLDPLAPILKKSRTNLPEEIVKWIPNIEKQLQINKNTYNCFLDKKSAKLYCLVNCKLESHSDQDLFLYYCNSVLKKELETIKKRIKEVVASLSSKDEIQNFIQKKHSDIQRLLDKLLTEINPNTFDELYELYNNCCEIKGLKLTYQYLEKLINYLEIDHYPYLDKKEKASYQIIIDTRKQIEPQYKQIYFYCNQSQPDTKVMKLIKDNLSKIIEPQLFHTVTYEELNYTIEFTTKLLELIKNKEDSNFLITYLLLLNFNSFDFFDYYTDTIIKELEKQPSEIEQIKLLYKYLKSTNQKQLHIQSKLVQNLPSTKEQIVAWIEEEIHYLNQKRLLEPYQPVKRDTQEINDKIQTGLSVPQLSYFFGLLIQTGIIQPKTQRAVFRFIANNFRTKITETISVDSINSKYYNVETATKMAVREKIIELLNLSKS